jgi:hypothetical protein
MNLSTATTAELLAFYNEHANKPVARFSDRKTAERRVNELMAAIKFSKPSPKKTAALAATPRVKITESVDAKDARLAANPKKLAPKAVGHDQCPRCGATSDITAGQIRELHGQQHLVNEHIAFCHTCGHSWDVHTGHARSEPRTSNPDRGAAIAASWQDKAVAERRAQRHAVRVQAPNGGEGNYKSVREAFMILALPLGQHIRFRGALKAAGRAEIQGHQFRLVERQG